MCETRHKNKDISKSRDGFTQIRVQTFQEVVPGTLSDEVAPALLDSGVNDNCPFIESAAIDVIDTN